MMRLLPLWLVVAASSEALCQDRPKAKEPEFFVQIEAPQALSYVDGDRQICEFKKPTIKLHRSDKQGTRVIALTLTGDTGTTQKLPGKELGTLTLKGNIRATGPDGTSVTADTAEIDLADGTFTYKGRLGTVPSEK